LPFSASADGIAGVGIIDESIRDFDGAFQKFGTFGVHCRTFFDAFT
jgi:hypothetical protein